MSTAFPFQPLPLAVGAAVVVLLGCGFYFLSKGRDRFGRALCGAAVVAATLLALAPVVSARPLRYRAQIAPDSFEYADGAQQLALGNGYVTYHHNDEAHPPRYPPGYSLALAPFAAFAGEFPSSVQAGAKAYTALYVLAAVAAAWVIGGPLAGVLTAALIGLSPFAREQARLIMSDAFGAALTVMLVGLAHRLSPVRVSLAGMLSGALVVVRLSAAMNILALALALPRHHRKRAIVFALPFVVGLGIYHWLTFGSPVRTGYDYWLPSIKSFDPSFALVRLPNMADPVADALNGALMSWACVCPRGAPSVLPNVVFYPAVIMGLFWVFAPPLSTLPGVLYIWTHRREPAANLALWLAAFSVLFYTFYFYQGTRFMAAPATILAVYSSVQLAEWLERGMVRTRLLGVGLLARQTRAGLAAS